MYCFSEASRKKAIAGARPAGLRTARYVKRLTAKTSSDSFQALAVIHVPRGWRTNASVVASRKAELTPRRRPAARLSTTAAGIARAERTRQSPNRRKAGKNA